MAVTRIEEGGLGTDSFNLPVTLNGTDGSSTDAGDNIVLDASASGVDAGERLLYEGIPPDFANISTDTSVLAGATLTVNDNGAISVASGGSVTIDSGATITNNGTATGFGSTSGTYDLNGEKLELDADADTSIIASTDDEIDIEIAGAAEMVKFAHGIYTFKGLDTGGAHDPQMILFRDSSSPADGDIIGSLIYKADNDAGEVTTFGHINGRIEDASNGTEDGTIRFSTMRAGTLTEGAILTENGLWQVEDGAVGTPSISFNGDTDTGLFIVGADELGIAVGGSRPIYSTNRKVCINDDATTDMSSGLCVNQTSYDNFIFELKSSDVANSTFTGNDYFHEVQPAAGASASVTGVCCWRGVVTADSYAYDSDVAIFTWRKTINGGSSRVIACIDEDGDFHLDAVSSDNSFDKYDDALLCRSVDLTIAKPKSIIKSEFDSWTDDHRERLTEVGILNRTDPSDPSCWHYPEDAIAGSPASKEPPWYDDTPLLNTTQLQRLHNGAIVQQRLMFETLKEVAEEIVFQHCRFTRG